MDQNGNFVITEILQGLQIHHRDIATFLSLRHLNLKALIM